jgi:Family of unknown function (DUF6326)
MSDIKVHVKFKLCALWTSVMFVYIYADYFGLYEPGALQHILNGKMGPLGAVTQTGLLGSMALMAVPSVMIFLSLVLKPTINRWANIVVGLAFTVIETLTLPGAWMYYILAAVVADVLTLLVVWYAWTWPDEALNGPASDR